MSELKPEDKKLHQAINKAMKDNNFYDTILEATLAQKVAELQAQLEAKEKIISDYRKKCKVFLEKGAKAETDNERLKEIISKTKELLKD
jgi:hypothetical protein